MLTLFGSPGETLFQLYPLLNHLLLFGGGYHGAVERAVSRLEAGAS